MIVRYLGGPLNGTVAEPGRAAWRRYVTYRRDDGTNMPPGQGDAIFIHNGRKRHGYVLSEMDGGTKAYIHASVYPSTPRETT